MAAIEVRYADDGQPCLVLSASRDLDELAELVERADKTAVWKGQVPTLAGAAFVQGIRHLLALSALVPQAAPSEDNDSPAARRWLTTTEVAPVLKITERAVRKRIAAGTIPARQLGGRWLIDTKDIA